MHLIIGAASVGASVDASVYLIIGAGVGFASTFVAAVAAVVVVVANQSVADAFSVVAPV